MTVMTVPAVQIAVFAAISDQFDAPILLSREDAEVLADPRFAVFLTAQERMPSRVVSREGRFYTLLLKLIASMKDSDANRIFCDVVEHAEQHSSNEAAYLKRCNNAKLCREGVEKVKSLLSIGDIKEVRVKGDFSAVEVELETAAGVIVMP